MKRPYRAFETARALPQSLPADRSKATGISEKRQHLRFDKMLAVSLDSPHQPAARYIARNVSEGGMFLESRDPLPLGSTVRVHFAMPDSDDEITAVGEVKNHYFLNFADAGGPRAICGMGIRFLAFEADGAESLQTCLRRCRVLH